MIIYLLGGVIVLVVFLMAGRAFVSANPETVKRVLLWGAGIAGLIVVALAIEAGLGVIVVVGGLGAGWYLFRDRFQQRGSSQPRGQVSEVETDYLRMTLDHATGVMTGTVRKGRFQGRRLEELDNKSLIALWRAVRAEDPPSVSLIEGYLDRFMPDWREVARGPADPGGSERTTATPMTPEEALAILGLKPGASPEEIKTAHHRLMMKIHPDQGGSDALAAQVNRAKDVLLGT
jgi:DnaJ-domain-containing protein 1